MPDKVTKIAVFEFEKETKNAVRFREVGDVPLIGPLYVQKHALAALGDVKAKGIKITIEIT